MPLNPNLKKVMVIGSGPSSSVRLPNLTMQVPRHAVL